MRGIDVSSYQGNIDWEKAKSDGVEFAILKVIRKDLQPDKMFEKNYAECQKHDILIQGTYNYSYATTVEKAKIDAFAVLDILDGRKPMVWLDIEDDCQKKLGERLVDIILAYKTIMDNYNVPFGVYTGLSFYNSYLKPYSSKLKGIPFWIARYPSSQKTTLKSLINPLKKPIIKHELYGWQFSSKGSVNGIKGSVDLNNWYVSKESNNYFTYEGGRYSYDTVKYGDSGSHVQLLQELLLKNNFKTAYVTVNGKQVRKKLEADGKFGPVTLSALKRYQGYVGFEQTGVCDEMMWKRLLFK